MSVLQTSRRPVESEHGPIRPGPICWLFILWYSSMHTSTVLLIDDHALFRAGLRMMLESGLPGIQVQESESLERMLHTEGCDHLHLILLDIHLQGMNGIDGIALVQRRWPGVPVVMLSSQFDAQTRQDALGHGAVALMSKAQTADAFVASVRRFLELGQGGVTAVAGPPAADALPRLTPRQAQILDLLCLGLSNKAIGRRLDLSEHTVRGHVQATFTALEVSSRSEATYVARRKGLVA